MILVEIFPDLVHDSFVIWCKNHSDILNENEDTKRTFFNEYIIYSHVSITKISNIKRDILTTLSFRDTKMHIEIVMNGKYPDDRNWRKKFKNRFNILALKKGGYLYWIFLLRSMSCDICMMGNWLSNKS